MYSKSLAFLLLLFAVFLIIGGAGAIIMSSQAAPMLIAMLSGLLVFGLTCLAAAYGVYKRRRFGFIICILLSLIAAAFALYVGEPLGQGMLWPTFAFLLANGWLGHRFSHSRRAREGGANGN